MTITLPKFSPSFIAALVLTCSGAAQASIPLSGEYSVTSFASLAGTNTWRFDYAVTNNNQGMGWFTGLDGFTILIPEFATVVSSTSPAPLNGAPGFWSASVGAGLFLLGNGSADFAAPTGYKSFTWWGNEPQSVYTPGSTAVFSITLGNVGVGHNAVGITSYFDQAIPAQEYAHNQWANYSTFIAQAVAPVSAVPEPETFAMLLAGLGLLGAIARKKQRKA